MLDGNDLVQISNLTAKLLEPIHKTLKKHSRELKVLKKNQEVMLDLLDREPMDQRRRLKRIEDRLDI